MRSSRTVSSLLVVLLLVGAVGGALAWRLMGDDKSASAPPRDLPDVTGVDVASAQAFGQRVPVRGVSRGPGYPLDPRGGLRSGRGVSPQHRGNAGLGDRDGKWPFAKTSWFKLATSSCKWIRWKRRSTLAQAQAGLDSGSGGLCGADALLWRSSWTPIAREERARIIRASSGLDQAEIAVQARRARHGQHAGPGAICRARG
jgi:hypothetical protein